jgi:hypothetical protein
MKGYFDDLVRDLNLSKREAEILGSRLQRWNLLHQDNEICFFRNRQNDFREFFSQENDTEFCNYVFSVTEALGHQHDPPQQRVFTDSSKVSLKAVLLHKKKVKQSRYRPGVAQRVPRS